MAAALSPAVGLSWATCPTRARALCHGCRGKRLRGNTEAAPWWHSSRGKRLRGDTGPDRQQPPGRGSGSSSRRRTGGSREDAQHRWFMYEPAPVLTQLGSEGYPTQRSDSCIQNDPIGLFELSDYNKIQLTQLCLNIDVLTIRFTI